MWSDSTPVYTKGCANNAASPYGFDALEAIAFDTVHHRLFVSDADNNRVVVYNLNTDVWSARGHNPPGGVDTETTGKIKVNFDEALTQAEFELRVFDGVGVTVAHLHCGRAGTNGRRWSSSLGLCLGVSMWMGNWPRAL